MTSEAEEKRLKTERFAFNIISEAKMFTFVDMAKQHLPADQVRQYCEVLLQRALEAKGVPE